MRGRDCKGASETERGPERVRGKKNCECVKRRTRGRKSKPARLAAETWISCLWTCPHRCRRYPRHHVRIHGPEGERDRVSCADESRPIKGFPPSGDGGARLHDSHHRGSIHPFVLIVVVVIFATAAIRALSSLGATICCDGLRGHDDGAVRLQEIRRMSTEELRDYRQTPA